MLNRYALIMAGGIGARFWPESREKSPKQLLNLSGEDILINETIERVSKIVGIENVFIITNLKQAELMNEVLVSDFNRENIIIEPMGRNTAPCIGYSAEYIYRKFGEGVMAVFPADHFIGSEEEFKRYIEKGIDIVSDSNKLLTLGITPSYPATGYGYIKGGENYKKESKEVYEFVEKPELEVARKYLSSGDYYWNSGMFIWKIKTIREAFLNIIPDEFDKIKSMFEEKINENQKQEIYSSLKSISIDYAIMEKAKNVVVLPVDFEWNDIGSWDAIEKIRTKDKDGNVLVGKTLSIETKGCTIFSKDKMIATVGLEDMVIVESDNSILVIKKDKAQDVKKIVEELKKREMKEYL